MGTWHLEVFRMTIYIFTPVVAFYGFHQLPFYKEDRMLDYQRKLVTLQSIEGRQMMEEAKAIAREAEQEALASKIKEHGD